MTDTAFCDTLKTLLAALGSNNLAQRLQAREQIRDTLAANRKSWNDLMAILHFGGKHGEKLKKRFAMLGQDNDGEFDNARQKVSDLLAEQKRTWEALVESLFSAASPSWSEWHQNASSHSAINALDLVHHLLQRYLVLTPHQSVAVSLWIVHTFVYQRFTVTPRLMLTSPIRGCGKTTLLDLIEALCMRALKSDSITAAAVYHAVDREHSTLLIDEGDNLDLAVNGVLRAVLNSGHRKGGKVTRCYHGQARSFATFAPAAVAAIGALPLTALTGPTCASPRARARGGAARSLDSSRRTAATEASPAEPRLTLVGQHRIIQSRASRLDTSGRPTAWLRRPLAPTCLSLQFGDLQGGFRKMQGEPIPLGRKIIDFKRVLMGSP